MLVVADKASVYDISYDFVNYFYGATVTPEGKRDILLAFCNLINNGWTVRELYLHINDFIKNNPQEVLNVSTYFNILSPKDINLLKHGNFYFHNALRIYPDPMTVGLDYETGIITKMETEYFLEMRASFTMLDLAEYFLTKGKLYERILAADTKRILGGAKWLLDKFDNDVELILYMIDSANEDIRDNRYKTKITNITEIQSYYGDAIKRRDFKKNECSLNGDVKVVPRKRMLSDRSGLLGRQDKQILR